MLFYCMENHSCSECNIRSDCSCSQHGLAWLGIGFTAAGKKAGIQPLPTKTQLRPAAAQGATAAVGKYKPLV